MFCLLIQTVHSALRTHISNVLWYFWIISYWKYKTPPYWCEEKGYDWSNWWQVSSKKAPYLKKNCHHHYSPPTKLQISQIHCYCDYSVNCQGFSPEAYFWNLFVIYLRNLNFLLSRWFLTPFIYFWVKDSPWEFWLVEVFSLPTWKTKPLVCGRRTHSVGSTTIEEATKHNWQPKIWPMNFVSTFLGTWLSCISAWRRKDLCSIQNTLMIISIIT